MFSFSIDSSCFSPWLLLFLKEKSIINSKLNLHIIQALYGSWGCSYDAHGLPFLYAGRSKIILIPLCPFLRYTPFSHLCILYLGLYIFLNLSIWCYSPWSFTQLFYLSGILTVFFCGIVMSHYTWHNVTESSRITTKYVSPPLFICLFVQFLYFPQIINWYFTDKFGVLQKELISWDSNSWHELWDFMYTVTDLGFILNKILESNKH